MSHVMIIKHKYKNTMTILALPLCILHIHPKIGTNNISYTPHL
jgi:hypothetical protein